MTTRSYTVLVEPEGRGGYRAFCPALPGCRSYGDTKKEAIRNIKLSISYRLETLMARGKPIPRDGDRSTRSAYRGRSPIFARE